MTITDEENKRKICCYDEEELIFDLLKVTKSINKIPNVNEYYEFGIYSIESFYRIRKWSEWQDILSTKTKLERTNSMKVPREDLIEDFKKVYKIINKVPSKTDYSNHGKYCCALYTKEMSWRAWQELVFGKDIPETAGKRPEKISDEELVKNLIELYDTLGRRPKKEDLTLGKYSINAYRRAFGNLANSLIKAGLFERQFKNVSKDEVADDIKEVYNKLGRTPKLEEYFEHSRKKFSYCIIKEHFESWNKALEFCNILVWSPHIVSKQDVEDALHEWHNKNNKSSSCLSYCQIAESHSTRDFPYGPETIKSKFEGMLWREIMLECGFTDYKTFNLFARDGGIQGKDGNWYISAIEVTVADCLFQLKQEGKILSYEYPKKVCEGRNWTCDFFITIKEDVEPKWLEIDGMLNMRREPYDSGKNEKIEYYKNNNMNFAVISYYQPDIMNKLLEILNLS
jgi:hypothetical protein